MNKLTKSAIAGGTGIALLLGGAGSFALWNSSATVAAGSVSSGTLSIEAAAAGTWYNVTNSPEATIDPASFKIVPGNTLEFRQTLTIEATGDDLEAELTYDAATVSGTITGLTSELTVTPGAGNVTVDGTTITVTDNAQPVTVDVVLTVALPVGATGGQGGTANLNALEFVLQQITPVNSAS